jgi:hypothetical protein
VSRKEISLNVFANHGKGIYRYRETEENRVTGSSAEKIISGKMGIESGDDLSYK